MAIPTVYQRKLQEAVPGRSAWIEAWGFVLLSMGILLALACYSFNPSDYTGSFEVKTQVKNLAGPVGAQAGAMIFTLFGLVGLLWPIVLTGWGLLTITGFMVAPKVHRVIGLLATSFVVCGFATLYLPYLNIPEPTFGYGGRVGFKIGNLVMPNFGMGGSFIVLSSLGLGFLVISGNLHLSKTASAFWSLRFYLYRSVKYLWKEVFFNENRRQMRLAKEARLAAHELALLRMDWQGEATNVPKMMKKLSGSAEKMLTTEAEDLLPGTLGGAMAASAKGEVEEKVSLDFAATSKSHGKPAINLFSKTAVKNQKADFSKTSKMLQEQLAEFKINGEIKGVTQGPVVTTYEFMPAPGTKVSKISSLGEDLARLLKAQSLRVLAPIPGKETVGFEVPNSERSVIGFGNLVDTDSFRSRKLKLPIAMGVDIFGKAVIEDLAEMPHLLVAGSTGSGKSVFMNTLIGSLISRHTAKDLRFIMIDPKMVEMAAYNDLPHMACPVITDVQNDAKQALDALVTEMDQRYDRMRELGVRNIDSFNEKIKHGKKSDFKNYHGKWQTMPYIVLIVDEMADMMMLLGKDVEGPIARLAQKARASGIHMVIATQRPSADVVTGLIKANFPTRVAFRVLSGIDSRTILDQSGAETLLGKGDMLYLASAGMNRLHGAYLSEKEVQQMVKACR